MKKCIVILFMILSLISNLNASYDKLAYEFSFRGIDGKLINLASYKNKVIVVVNVASRCGYTPQYKDLQQLWINYKEKDLVVIGVPTNNFKQEPGTNTDIKKFCESTYGINFPLAEKTNVIGSNAHPFYVWARKNHGIGAIPKWNFHKIIVNKNGKISDTFASFTKPTSKKFINLIEEEIRN
tara:strand:- start:90 stop:635 length:546 start_codon:yes stop_codon:yes gene_type:complete